MAQKIEYSDNLKKGTDKLNESIEQSNVAYQKAITAEQTANQAIQHSESTQTQLDNIVIEGDSSVEAAQARVDSKGESFPTLKSRLDNFEVSATQQLQQIEEGAVFTATYFGVKADGVTDDTSQLQNYISYCQEKSKTVKLPSGIMIVSQPLLLNSKRVDVVGEGLYNSVVRSVSSMESVFLFEDFSMNTAFNFRQFTIDGGAVSNYGLKSLKLEHSTISIRVIRTLKSAVLFGSGWCNDFIGCMITSNLGNGIEFSALGANNVINIMRNKIFKNDGIGVLIKAGHTVNLVGNTIESNKKCGVLSQFGVNSLVIDGNYFEANSRVGLVFENPATTIKSDVILNGSNVIERFSYSSPTKDVSLKNNTHQMISGSDAAYTLLGVDNITVENNSLVVGAAPLINTPIHNGLTNIERMVVGNNSFPITFKPFIYLDQNYLNMHTWQISKEIKTSFIPIDLTGLKIILSGMSSTLSNGELEYDGSQVGKINLNETGNSNFYGFEIDMADYPHLIGRSFYFSVIVKQSTANMAANIYVLGSGWRSNAHSPQVDWKEISYHGEFQEFGKMRVALGITSGPAGSSLHFTKPRLVIID